MEESGGGSEKLAKLIRQGGKHNPIHPYGLPNKTS